MNIFERKQEAASATTPLVAVTEDTTDPAKWGVNWPKQYDSYLLTAQTTRTRFGGHGGSEALPAEKIERDPWLKRMFLGYAFSIDYRDRRGHAYMLEDQEQTERQTKPQTGSCLHCHASMMPLYRELGGGDAKKGFEESYKISVQGPQRQAARHGSRAPGELRRLPRPEDHAAARDAAGLHRGHPQLAASDAATPHLPSHRALARRPASKPYDPNTDATRTEMRSYRLRPVPRRVLLLVADAADLPLGQGPARRADQEEYWNEIKFASGERFFDYKHAETGAPILKAQHPEFELWSQGVHARSGVACADCHMPYGRDGATKVSDHWVRSPLLNINRACQTCHKQSEDEIKARVDLIQQRNFDAAAARRRGHRALIDAIRRPRRAAPRPSSCSRRWNCSARRSGGWTSSRRRTRWASTPRRRRREVLGEAIDYARQGETVVAKLRQP